MKSKVVTDLSTESQKSQRLDKDVLLDEGPEVNMQCVIEQQCVKRELRVLKCLSEYKENKHH